MQADLVVDWCSYEAAKFAITHWHYSKTMPVGKLIKLGAWENNEYIGCVIFGRGATPNIAKPYNLTQYQVCELVRVALCEHLTKTSEIISKTLKMLRTNSNDLRLVVSYADKDQEHIGIIYQAGNWIFTGLANEGTRSAFIINGVKTHPRTIGAMGGIQSLGWIKRNLDPMASEYFTTGKYKYLYPLDRAMRRQIAPLAQPYPKKITHAGEVSTVITPLPVEGAGSTPAARSEIVKQ